MAKFNPYGNKLKKEQDKLKELQIKAKEAEEAFLKVYNYVGVKLDDKQYVIRNKVDAKNLFG